MSDVSMNPIDDPCTYAIDSRLAY